MALDIYWQHYHERRYLGSLAITDALTEPLYRLEQAAGVPADSYGNGRLYPAQWQRLLELAPAVPYPVALRAAIQARIPPDQPQGILILAGD